MGQCYIMSNVNGKKVLDSIRENMRILNSCVGPHDFVAIDPNSVLNRMYRCKKCGGELDRLKVMWYRKGVEHMCRES